MNSQTFFKLWAVVENMFPVQVSDTVHRGWTDGQFFDFTPIKCFKSPLKDLLGARKKWLPNTLITFQSKYYLRNRATPGRLHFFRVGLEICRLVTYMLTSPGSVGLLHPLPPVTTDLMMISSLTIISIYFNFFCFLSQ